MATISFAQKQEKDIKYYYYYLDQDQHFVSYLNARREVDAKKLILNFQYLKSPTKN